MPILFYIFDTRKSRSVNFFFPDRFSTFPGIREIEKCQLFVSGPIFDAFLNPGNREVSTFFVGTDFRLFPESGKSRSVNYLLSGPIFDFVRNPGNREVSTVPTSFRLFPESGKSRSANYLFLNRFETCSGIRDIEKSQLLLSYRFSIFAGIREIEKCQLFVSGHFFDFFRNPENREVSTILFRQKNAFLGFSDLL